MIEKIEKQQLTTNLPTERILDALKTRIKEAEAGIGKVTKLDHGKSNTVAAVYLVQLEGKPFVVKTYKPLSRGGKQLTNTEVAANMRASVLFHREFFQLTRFMVDTDVMIADIGDGEGEQVCVIQEHAKGNKVNIHMKRMADQSLEEEFMSNWAYGPKDTEKKRQNRQGTGEQMLTRYAQEWVRRMGSRNDGHKQQVSPEEARAHIGKILHEMDGVLSLFIKRLLELLSMPTTKRRELYKDLRFVMRSAPDRAAEAVPVMESSILAADLFRGRNIIIDALEGRAVLFDFADLREFESVEMLMDHYVTSLRQAFLVHPDPAYARESLNETLSHITAGRIHPKDAVESIPDIPGEYSLLLPFLPQTETALLNLVAQYKAVKNRPIGSRVSQFNIKKTRSQVVQVMGD